MCLRLLVNGGALLLVTLGTVACGGSDDEKPAPVPIESIPDEKPLDELSEAEVDGVCEWSKEVAREVLPEPGTRYTCGSVQIQISPARCNRFHACDATIADFEGCLPQLMARIADDPCQLLDILTDSAAKDFVETTPGCEPLGACSWAL